MVFLMSAMSVCCVMSGAPRASVGGITDVCRAQCGVKTYGMCVCSLERVISWRDGVHGVLHTICTRIYGRRSCSVWLDG